MPLMMMRDQAGATAAREQRARDEAAKMYGLRRADTLADQVQQQANWKAQQDITAGTTSEAAQLRRTQEVEDARMAALQALGEDEEAWSRLDPASQDRKIAQVTAQFGTSPDPVDTDLYPVDTALFRSTPASRMAAATRFTQAIPFGEEADQRQGILRIGDTAVEELARQFHLGPTTEPWGPSPVFPHGLRDLQGQELTETESDIGRALRDVVEQGQQVEGSIRAEKQAREREIAAARAAGNFPFQASLNALNQAGAASGRAAGFAGAGSPVTLRIGAQETGALAPRLADPYTVATPNGQTYLLEEGWSGILTLLGTDQVSGIPYVQYEPVSLGVGSSPGEAIDASTGQPRGGVVKGEPRDRIAPLDPNVTISPFAASPLPGLGSILDILDMQDLEQVKNWYTKPTRGLR
jgi:hypothetical protein